MTENEEALLKTVRLLSSKLNDALKYKEHFKARAYKAENQLAELGYVEEEEPRSFLKFSFDN